MVIDFVEAVEELLVVEHCLTRDDAKAMIKRWPEVMVKAMMAGRGKEYRACAMALEMKDGRVRRRLRLGR